MNVLDHGKCLSPVIYPDENATVVRCRSVFIVLAVGQGGLKEVLKVGIEGLDGRFGVLDDLVDA